MDITNEMKIEFLSKSANESFARVAVSSFVSQLDPTVEQLCDIKTAVSEAVTNSIVHAYDEAGDLITLKVKTFLDSSIEIIISDKGKGIEDIEKARQPLFTTGNSDERSGMGFTVMETFMDEVLVTSQKGEGTTVIMRKKLR